MKRALGTFAVVGALVVAIGCGSSSDESTASAAEAWASDVCTAITTWQTTIGLTVDSVTTDPSRASIETAVNDARAATDEFVQTLDELGAPETDAGDAARQSLGDLSTGLSDDVETIQGALENTSSISGIRGAVTTVAATLSAMGDKIDSTFSDLQDLDAGDEVKQAFADSPDCEELRTTP